MICPSCEAVIRDCECSLMDGDCVTFDGSGNNTPLVPRFNFDPDPDNIASSSASGDLVLLPLAIRTPPACCVYNDANISLTNETSTVLTFNQERFDNDSMHSTVTNTSRITFTTAGIYAVRLGVSFTGNTAGDRQLYIRANGRDFLGANQRRATVATIEAGLTVTVEEIFEAGDYVEGLAKQDSTTTLNALTNRYSPVFAAKYRRGLPG